MPPAPTDFTRPCDKHSQQAGRPIRDWCDFDNLCGLHCSIREIASWFDCSEDTIKRGVKREKRMTFEEYRETKLQFGKIAVRRKQMELAQAGDRTMLIWLGKQMLGQTDKQEVGGRDGGPVEHVVRVVYDDVPKAPASAED